jgi:hypothetical protein
MEGLGPILVSRAITNSIIDVDLVGTELIARFIVALKPRLQKFLQCGSNLFLTYMICIAMRLLNLFDDWLIKL